MFLPRCFRGRAFAAAESRYIATLGVGKGHGVAVYPKS